MKKVILAAVICAMAGTLFAAEPAAKSAKITNTRIVQAAQDTTLNYGGVKVFVPKGQTVILGQNAGGSVVVRGQNLKGVKVADASITAPGAAVLSVNPKDQVITVSKGNNIQVTDANGRTAEVSQGASVSAKDIRTATAPALAANAQSNAAKAQKAVTKAQAKAVKAQAKIEAKAAKEAAATQATSDTVETVEVPAFVAATQTSDTAVEQATQNVDETENVLSPSAPR